MYKKQYYFLQFLLNIYSYNTQGVPFLLHLRISLLWSKTIRHTKWYKPESSRWSYVHFKTYGKVASLENIQDMFSALLLLLDQTSNAWQGTFSCCSGLTQTCRRQTISGPQMRASIQESLATSCKSMRKQDVITPRWMIF